MMDGAKNGFQKNRRLAWVAEEWQRYADKLAEWAMERLVNRRDVWSQYTLKDGEVRVVMLPIKERRKAGTDMVTLKKLTRHFAGKAVSHLIGLHSISDHRTAKWFTIDIDLHDKTVVNADEIAWANFAAAREWSKRLRNDGFDPILMDSDGAGGFHVWVLLDKEYPLADVYDYVNGVRSDWENFGLPRKPEVFPPKREVEDDDLPYALRLPGRHHTRLHFTRVWNFDSIGENDWLDGGEAIEALLAADPKPLPKTKRKRKVVAAPRKAKPKAPARKPRVCLDLDGVLARYEGWNGAENIGPPLPGALDFANSLSKIADIVIFTSRCSPDAVNETGMAVDASRMRIRIIDWLERNKFPFKDVYVGQGKPRAAAFIDDRAIACSPQLDKNAFKVALAKTRLFLGGKKRRTAQ